MELPAHYHNPYPRLAGWYDWMAKLMLIPFGGERAFRSSAIDALDVAPAMDVLEVGCGTGAMTALLLARGADVTAVDLSTPMLAHARRRAARARFRHQDILALREVATFDRVLVAFVLHEMDRVTRRAALAVCRRAVRPGGLIGVLDFALPAAWGPARALQAYLRVAEPASARELIERGLEAELESSGLSVVRTMPLAWGTSRMVVTTPSPG